MSDKNERAVGPAMEGWVEIYLEVGYLVPSRMKFVNSMVFYPHIIPHGI